MDNLQDIIESIVDRLPYPVQQVYDHLPPMHTLSKYSASAYSLVSQIPYLPTLLALLSFYAAFSIVMSTIRRAFGLTRMIARYGALAGLAYSAYNYINGGVPADGNGGGGLMAQGQHLFNQFTGGNTGGVPDLFGNTKPSTGTRRSTRRGATARKNEGATDPVTGLFNSVMSGKGLTGIVWDQVKSGFEGLNAQPVDDDKKRRRNKKASEF